MLKNAPKRNVSSVQSLRSSHQDQTPSPENAKKFDSLENASFPGNSEST